MQRHVHEHVSKQIFACVQENEITQESNVLDLLKRSAQSNIMTTHVSGAESHPLLPKNSTEHQCEKCRAQHKQNVALSNQHARGFHIEACETVSKITFSVTEIKIQKITMALKG